MPVSTPTRKKYHKKKTYSQKRKKQMRMALFFIGILMIIVLLSVIVSLFQKKEKSKAYEKGSAPWTIGLDAGHGGSDPGAQGIVSEVDMTEQTVRELSALLAKDKRFKVALCRDYGETVEKTSMRAIAGNKQGADLLISIHGNSDQTGQGYGFECYPIPPGRELNSPSLEFAEHLAQAFEKQGARLRGSQGIRYAYYEGEDGNTKVIREGSDTTEYSSQTFGFLESAEVPAVLAEQCFITNPQDAELFAMGNGIQRAAKAYYSAICAFFEVEPLE